MLAVGVYLKIWRLYEKVQDDPSAERSVFFYYDRYFSLFKNSNTYYTEYKIISILSIVINKSNKYYEFYSFYITTYLLMFLNTYDFR